MLETVLVKMCGRFGGTVVKTIGTGTTVLVRMVVTVFMELY